ncbi:hypothetical protein H0A36_14810 [Endozoicomonas sp. SM1973]|uniref:Uncharacterized protein n=1 Tax=Spartinivicinus marinus TaxID=2994442 RepID=A0A853ICN6_9GAMM|nr:hypothetical protein [Spartinivicinus marinus]MCX4026368.1 hypothetical protein [Spartinivicinus marinus]NYZ67287.1 hypothetical protein [Spartinivicinus marinus]
MKLLHTLVIAVIFLPTTVQAIPTYLVNLDTPYPKIFSNYYFFSPMKVPLLTMHMPPYRIQEEQSYNTNDLFIFNTSAPAKKQDLSTPPKKKIKKQENFIKILAAGIISMKLLGSKSAN